MTSTDQQLREQFTFAYQPIVDVEHRTVWAYEALVRGPAGESAFAVLDQFSGDSLLDFDQAARVRAFETASRLGYQGRLCVNMLNQSLHRDIDVLGETITAAAALGFHDQQVTVEVSEKDEIGNLESFLSTIRPARGLGTAFALDDFGAGHSGLNLLAGFQPDFIKLDMELIKGIWKNGPRQAIVRGVMRTAHDLGIEVIAEGIEEPEEFEWLWSVGTRLFQGYLFARPGFEEFPEPKYPPFD